MKTANKDQASKKKKYEEELKKKYPLPQSPDEKRKAKEAAERKAWLNSDAYRKEGILKSLQIGGTDMTISEIMEICPEVADKDMQEVAKLIRQLVLSGEVVRTEAGRKAYFSIAP